MLQLEYASQNISEIFQISDRHYIKDQIARGTLNLCIAKLIIIVKNN